MWCNQKLLFRTKRNNYQIFISFTKRHISTTSLNHFNSHNRTETLIKIIEIEIERCVVTTGHDNASSRQIWSRLSSGLDRIFFFATASFEHRRNAFFYNISRKNLTKSSTDPDENKKSEKRRPHSNRRPFTQARLLCCVRVETLRRFSNG